MSKRNDIKVIGLTGGIASGKSSVSRFFSEKGIAVIDADSLAREAVLPGTKALKKIVAVFGKEMLLPDGSLDRKHLGKRIFASVDKRRQLEEILHPEIKRLAEKLITRLADEGDRLVIYMAPLLIEAGAVDRVDEIWVVTVRPEIQLTRLMERDAIGRDEAEQIIASQMPLAEKEKHARLIIDNSGTPEETSLLLAGILEKERINIR